MLRGMFKSVHTRQYAAMLRCLIELRRSTGLTQVQLAERLDIQQTDVSKCERGARRLDVLELRRWVMALGSSLPAFCMQVDEAITADELMHAQALK